MVADPEGADVAVLNTCGFIDSAKSEAIDNILELAELKTQGKLGKLLVAGCLSQRYQGELSEEMPEVDGVLGTGSYTDIVSALEAVTGGGHPACFGDIDHTEEDGARMVSTPPYTAYLKIAEGCDNRCSYCIIPYLRGRYRSRSMESLLAEAKALADRGVKELIVIAQDITRYGTDLYGRRAGRAAHRAVQAALPLGAAALPVPRRAGRRPHRRHRPEPKILKYIDIPLQHINDADPEGHEPPGHQGGDPGPAGQAAAPPARPGAAHLPDLRPARRGRGRV